MTCELPPHRARIGRVLILTECTELVQGLPPSAFARLQAVDNHVLDDVYSAVCRPGSWEWATVMGARLRCELQQLGYLPEPDEVSPWRVTWVRPELAARCPVAEVHLAV